MKNVYLTLAAVLRDQEHYVREWLCFQHLIGVERMVVVLHKCNDKTEDEIRRLPFFEEKVRLHRIVNDEQRVQMGAFRWMIDTYRERMAVGAEGQGDVPILRLYLED